MANVVLALIKAKALQQRTDGCPERLERARLGAAQQAFELGKNLFNGVEVRTVRRQVPQRSTGPFNVRPDAGDFVRAQVIHHQRRQQPLGAQRTNKRGGVPVAKRRVAQTALAFGRAAPGGRHAGGGPCFVQKNQWPLPAHGQGPLGERLGYVAARLLAGTYKVFFFVSNRKTESSQGLAHGRGPDQHAVF